MSSPREILQALIDAADAVENQIAEIYNQSDELRASVADLKVARDMAYQELDTHHHVVVFVGKGGVGHVFTDTDIHMSCMVVNFEIDPNAPNDPRLTETTWTRSQTKSDKFLADHEFCDFDPVIVSDVVRAFDALRDKGTAWLRDNWDKFKPPKP